MRLSLSLRIATVAAIAFAGCQADVASPSGHGAHGFSVAQAPGGGMFSMESPMPSARGPVVPVIGPVHVQLVCPVGAFTKMRAGLRILSAVPASDLTRSDLERLSLSINGRLLAPNEYTIGDMIYDDETNLVVDIRLAPIVCNAGTLRVATPGRSFVLLADLTPSCYGETVTVNAESTAKVLLDQMLRGEKLVSEQDRQRLIEILTAKVYNLYTSNRTGSVEASDDLTEVALLVMDAVLKGTPIDRRKLAKLDPRTAMARNAPPSGQPPSGSPSPPGPPPSGSPSPSGPPPSGSPPPSGPPPSGSPPPSGPPPSGSPPPSGPPPSGSPSPSASPGGAVTISQLLSNTQRTVSMSSGIAQTFTVPTAGNLTKVECFVGTPPPNPATVTMRLYATDGTGQPTGSALAQETITVALGPPDYRAFNLTTPVAMAADSVYAVYISIGTSASVNAGVSNANPYAGGKLFTGAVGGPWTAVASQDLQFRVFLSP